MSQKHHLLGGFAYVDEFTLGCKPPICDILDINQISDTSIAIRLRYGYDGDLSIKGQVYAPINPLHAATKIGRRGRLHMNQAESAAPGYINAWGCVRDLWIEGVVEVLLTLSTDPDTPSVAAITLDSFPVKRVAISFSFDGSVLADKAREQINGTLTKIDKKLQDDHYTIVLPVNLPH